MSFSGQFSGIGASDFLLGDFSNYTQISGLSSRLHQTLPSAYVQDDIKLTPRLTVNAGVRWDIVSGYHSEDGQLMTLQPGRQSTVFPLATPESSLRGRQRGTRRYHRNPNGIPSRHDWELPGTYSGRGKTSLRQEPGNFLYL